MPPASWPKCGRTMPWMCWTKWMRHRDVLLNNLTPEDALELRALLTFDPDTAAGVMNTEIILIQADMTVDDAIRQIRSDMEDKEMPYYVYVVDDMDKLAGVLSLRDLMLTRPGTRIRDILGKQELITVAYDTDKAEVARQLGHYNFLSLPVVDREGHLMGVVTHDDVIDTLQTKPAPTCWAWWAPARTKTWTPPGSSP